MNRRTITILTLTALLSLSGSPAWALRGDVSAGEMPPVAIDDHIYLPDETVPDVWVDMGPVYDI